MNPGDIISVAVYYHNTGPDTATTTRVSLSPMTTTMGTSHTILGNITASNSNQAGTGQATVYTSNNTRLNFVPGGAYFYPDKQTFTTPIPFGQSGVEAFTGGLNIGNIDPPSSCAG